MYNAISESCKSQIIKRFYGGDKISDLANEFKITRTSIYRWIKKREYEEKYKTADLLSTVQIKRNIEQIYAVKR